MGKVFQMSGIQKDAALGFWARLFTLSRQNSAAAALHSELHKLQSSSWVSKNHPQKCNSLSAKNLGWGKSKNSWDTWSCMKFCFDRLEIEKLCCNIDLKINFYLGNNLVFKLVQKIARVARVTLAYLQGEPKPKLFLFCSLGFVGTHCSS